MTRTKEQKEKHCVLFFLFLVNSAFIVPSCHIRAEGNTEFSESKSHVQSVWPEHVICSQMEAAFPGSSRPSAPCTDVTWGKVLTGRAEPLRVLHQVRGVSWVFLLPAQHSTFYKSMQTSQESQRINALTVSSVSS